MPGRRTYPDSASCIITWVESERDPPDKDCVRRRILCATRRYAPIPTGECVVSYRLYRSMNVSYYPDSNVEVHPLLKAPLSSGIEEPVQPFFGEVGPLAGDFADGAASCQA